MRENKTEPMPFSGWLRDNADGYKDREALVAAALKIFPKKKRSHITRSIRDLARRGDIKPKPPTDESPKRGVPPGHPVRRPSGKKVPKKFRMAVDVSAVKDEYDDESKIDEGIKNLGDNIIKDNDFRVELGIAVDRWKLVSSLEKYNSHKIELRGKQFKGVYWGQTPVLAGLREKIDMV